VRCIYNLHALDSLKGVFFSAWNHDIRGKVHSLPLICRPPPPGFTACEKKKINFKNESAKKKFFKNSFLGFLVPKREDLVPEKID
jgi:hypothetical protein